MSGKRRNIQKAMKAAVASTLSLSLLCAPLAGADAAEATGTMVVTESGSTGWSDGTASAAMLDESQAKVTKEEAEAKLRALFPLLNQARLDRVEFGNPHVYPPRDEAIWNFHWSISEGNSSYGFNTTVDALNGEVLNYYYPYGNFTGNNEAYYPPKVTETEAETIAKAFINKASSSVNLSELKSGGKYGGQKRLFGPVQYHFYYQVNKNGIPSNSESVNVAVDGNGEIVSYNRYRYEGDYPSAVPALTKAQAEEKFKNTASLALSYIPENPYSYYQNDFSKWMLAYVPETTNGSMLDAHTGEFISWDGKASASSGKYLPIPSEGPVFKENAGKPLTSDEAAAVVTEHAAIPDGYRANAYLDKYWQDPKVQVWNISWQNQNMGPFGFSDQISAYVEAESGRLLNLNRHTYHAYYTGEEPKKVPAPSITEQEANKRAMELIRMLYPNAAKELKLKDTPALIDSETSEAKFRYEFQHFYGDYPVHNGNVQLTLDGNGKLYSYYTSGASSAKLADKLEGLTAQITLEEALRLYTDALTAELQYVRFGGYYDETMNRVPEDIKLVYSPVVENVQGYAIIDASSGKLQAHYPVNLPAADEAAVPEDVTGHWASSALTAMVEHGVMEVGEDGLLHPNDKLSLGDWILIMSRALYGNDLNYYGNRNNEMPFADVTEGSDYYYAVQRFVDQRWLDRAPGTNLEPEQALTRDRLAVLLIRMLNYTKLAEFMNDDLEIALLKDADRIRNKGAVSIVTKLGLLTPSNGKFNPDAHVTKAQAATIIMRLVTLQGKTDSSVFGYY